MISAGFVLVFGGINNLKKKFIEWRQILLYILFKAVIFYWTQE